ncbi:MAG TPA: hypothetical protein VFZ25_17890 [Chloroflexota bacterium]|nr:hypothetical protein [Chloroflexota bacterium]
MTHEIPEDIAARIRAIASDEVSGASALARAGLRIVGDDAARAAVGDAGELLERVREVSEAVARARPEMAPIRVWQERLIGAVERRAASAENAAALREEIGAAVDELVARSEAAGKLAIAHAVARLAPGSVVFTASDSMTIREAIQAAHRAGKLRRVLVAESADNRGHRYGALLAEGVRAAGVPAEVVPDAAVAARVAEADRIWLGADTVFSDGTLLNGIGSLALARAARAAGRPVEIILETAKVVPQPPPENLALPPEMDRVPGDLIAAVVSEDGIVFNRGPAGNDASADRR